MSSFELSAIIFGKSIQFDIRIGSKTLSYGLIFEPEKTQQLESFLMEVTNDWIFMNRQTISKFVRTATDQLIFIRETPSGRDNFRVLLSKEESLKTLKTLHYILLKRMRYDAKSKIRID